MRHCKPETDLERYYRWRCEIETALAREKLLKKQKG